MSAQSEGEYAEALRSYYKAMRLEIDSYDRSYILHNIGLIHTSNGKHAKALENYFQALERNSFLPQAFNNMAVICHYVRLFRTPDSLVHNHSINEKGFPQVYFKMQIATRCGIVSLQSNPYLKEINGLTSPMDN
ncbi:hypothetical protein KP509_30G067700 [Ceratopteris richardii]|uniref:Photosystem I assembly protein Ycf3 n=1 Tax=Ceratopteris richardii TaxID=49495 RepID=A0A8T2R3C2_CERRI|nr:hypothetical protein KP509_30G067700 [Ceratopteris richardii]